MRVGTAHAVTVNRFFFYFTDRMYEYTATVMARRSRVICYNLLGSDKLFASLATQYTDVQLHVCTMCVMLTIVYILSGFLSEQYCRNDSRLTFATHAHTSTIRRLVWI